jgi:flagellar biosynthetic protein FlhB
MADNNSMERTERATPKRLSEAREKGQVPRSRDLNTLLLLLASAAGLLVFGEGMISGLMRQMATAFSRPRAGLFDPRTLAPLLGDILVNVLIVFLPFLLLLFAVVLVSPAALGGWTFSPQALMPDFSRLDPVSGLGRLFSRRAPVEALKAIAKFVVVALVSSLLLYHQAPELFRLGAEPLERGLLHSAHVLGWSFLAISSVLILIVLVDVPFQLWDHANRLKMTRQEVKDEYRQTEGSPEVKGRIRTVQRRMAQQRMMQDVPTADVVVTNPTHYAIALRYDQEQMVAPKVIAMGADLIAAEIRKVAAANDVTIVEAPALARALYYHTDIGQEIPAGLYVAVAQLLAYVYQLRVSVSTGRQVPEPPAQLPIPDDLQHD